MAECQQFDRKDAEIMWLRSALATLMLLAETQNPQLTMDQVACCCRVALSKYSGADGEERS